MPRRYSCGNLSDVWALRSWSAMPRMATGSDVKTRLKSMMSVYS